MSPQEGEHRSTDSGRRTFLKGVSVATASGLLGSRSATACTPMGSSHSVSPEAPEDAWRMIGQNPAHTGFNRVANGPEPPIDVKWHVSGLPGRVWPPVVLGDTVYAATLTLAGEPAGDLRAFSTESGANRWLFVPSVPNVGVPAVDDSTIYVGGVDRNINAVDRETKSLRWTFDIDRTPAWPVVGDGTVYIAEFPADPRSGSTIYAIDAESGDEQWRFERQSGFSWNVAVFDGVVYIGSDSSNYQDIPDIDTNLYAVDATTGDEQWRFEAALGPTNTPAVAHKTVYIASADTNVYAVDATSGEERWRFEESSAPLDIPAVDDEAVYVPAGDRSLSAIDAVTGDPRWRFEGATGAIDPQPVVGGETVYFGTQQATVYAVDTASGEEQWRFEEATAPIGSPVVVGDTLYVGTYEGSLYAVT